MLTLIKNIVVIKRLIVYNEVRLPDRLGQFCRKVEALKPGFSYQERLIGCRSGNRFAFKFFSLMRQRSRCLFFF